MKRLLIAALALSLALSLTLAGCGGTGGTPAADSGAGAETGADGAGSASYGGGAIASVDDLRAALERDHADAEWYPDIAGITLETYLGAPVLTFRVPWSDAAGDFEAQNRKQSALADALGAYDITIAPNYALITADGSLTPIGGGGVGVRLMQEAFDLPPAPQTAEEIRAWLETVYGPGGLVPLGPDESWYGSITSIGMGDYGSGANDVLMVTVNAPGGSVDISLAAIALRTTGSPLLGNYSIQTDDGSGSLAGAAGAGEPGSAGWLYPAE
jgi:hypothetical protein